MTSDHDLRALWASAPEGGEPPIDLERVRARATKLAGDARRRNVRETIAGVLGAALVAWIGLSLQGLVVVRVGCALLVVGQAIVLARLWTRGVPSASPSPAAPTREHLAHLRSELARERELLKSVLSWYIAPIAPGVLLIPIGALIAMIDVAPALWIWATGATFAAATMGVFAVIRGMNRRAAEKLARELEALRADP